MDPAYLTSDIWHDLSTALRFIWLYVFLILGFVTNFLIAHALIPSLASTHHIPQSIVKLRAVVYLLAFGALATAVIVFLLTLLSLDVAARVLPRWWI